MCAVFMRRLGGQRHCALSCGVSSVTTTFFPSLRVRCRILGLYNLIF
jgi:hypothetical protein